jgi:DNA replication protein DnaC
MAGKLSHSIEMYSKHLKTPTFNQYEEVIRQLDKTQGYEDFLLNLLKLEYDSRTEKSRQRKVKTAGFPYLKTFDELDVSRFEHMSEPFLRELASCDFIKKRQNIVMIGNPGTGKTHLSIALGIRACTQGINVKFYTAANLANELIEAQEYKKLVRLEKQISKAELLIIDELSYLTFNRHQSELLFKVIADRAERQSVIVSTNLKFSDWISMFENKTMVTALIDRLTFRSHVLNMNSSNPYRTERAGKDID